MADKFIIPSDRQPWLDPATGLITRPWFLFLQGMFSRIGGATGTGSPVFDALILELQTQDAMAESLAPALAEQLRTTLALMNDMNTTQAMADVPNYEVVKRVNDLETLGAFSK